MKAVVVKTAQVSRESKIARDMLCFTIETAAGGREGRRCRTGGCGLCSRYVRAMFALCSRYVRAMFALCSREIAVAGEFRARGKESNVRHIIGECHCRLLDAL